MNGGVAAVGAPPPGHGAPPRKHDSLLSSAETLLLNSSDEAATRRERDPPAGPDLAQLGSARLPSEEVAYCRKSNNNGSYKQPVRVLWGGCCASHDCVRLGVRKESVTLEVRPLHNIVCAYSTLFLFIILFFPQIEMCRV